MDARHSHLRIILISFECFDLGRVDGVPIIWWCHSPTHQRRIKIHTHIWCRTKQFVFGGAAGRGADGEMCVSSHSILHNTLGKFSARQMYQCRVWLLFAYLFAKHCLRHLFARYFLRATLNSREAESFNFPGNIPSFLAAQFVFDFLGKHKSLWKPHRLPRICAECGALPIARSMQWIKSHSVRDCVGFRLELTLEKST